MDKEYAEWASGNGRPDERTDEEIEAAREQHPDLADLDWLFSGAPCEMEQDLTEVTVPKKPKCDFCDEQAEFDGKTNLGPWAYMCNLHFGQYGLGLGLGLGQKLEVQSEDNRK